MDEYSLSMACLFGALEPISRPSRQFDSLAFGITFSNAFQYGYNTFATLDVSCDNINGSTASFLCNEDGEVLEELEFAHPDPRVDQTVRHIHGFSDILIRTINSPIHFGHSPGQPDDLAAVFDLIAPATIPASPKVQLSLFVHELSKGFSLTAGTRLPWELESDCPLFSILVDPLGEMLLLHTATGVEAISLGRRGLSRVHTLVLRLVGHNMFEASKVVAMCSANYLPAVDRT